MTRWSGCNRRRDERIEAGCGELWYVRELVADLEVRGRVR
ncbi:hypothetical protein [Alloactinosynnema sp. L-07]|nr:hypothetical protein [Alloactinosynnema sp. L-07]